MRIVRHGDDGVDEPEFEDGFALLSPTGRVLAEWDEDPRPLWRAQEARSNRLEGIVVGLFRCEHGRKAGDVCGSGGAFPSGCGGPSVGGPMQGKVIGHTLDGDEIKLRAGDWGEAIPALLEGRRDDEEAEGGDDGDRRSAGL